MSNPGIHLAFRFHGNFYHSYRGDTPDELGFGKDIRIIRHIIKTLDQFNAAGIPVRGTWDFENYFSLETLMPQYCPDIITDMQRRIGKGLDEANLMSYNNGLVSALTAFEFEAAIRRGIVNDRESGLHDLFGNGFYPMVRPQEMMFTPIHLKLYPACGIHAISLFYSAIPFNAFSNFVPPLSLLHRHNPITLKHPSLTETMTLMPCFNTGDLLDHLSLRRWVLQLRKYQLAMRVPQDMLLLIDMDADDTFWTGFNIPVIGKKFSTAKGLTGLVDSVKDLEYIQFTTPGAYLENHPPLISLTINQDTADGSFDGMSSWAEKWINQQVWTGLERGRLMELQARHLLKEQSEQRISEIFAEVLDLRLKITSTTHFGMSAPVMNLTREKTVCDLVDKLQKMTTLKLQSHLPPQGKGQFSLADFKRGIDTPTIQYAPKPSKALIRLPLSTLIQSPLTLVRESGDIVPSATITGDTQAELVFVEQFESLAKHGYQLVLNKNNPELPQLVRVTAHAMENGRLHLAFDAKNRLTKVSLDGAEYFAGGFMSSAVRYAGRDYAIDGWEVSESYSMGGVGVKRLRGSVDVRKEAPLVVKCEMVLAAELPYIYITMQVAYPQTPNHCQAAKAERLQRQWDDRWQEVRPCELHPNFASQPEQPLRVWKHNYCDHVSSYDLNYDTFSKNTSLDSINNHVTDAWVAVSDGKKGLLLAQTAEVNASMAFCPMRVKKSGSKKHIQLNPFGSYSGRQYHYATRDTGLGRLLAVTMSASDHIRPYAPSYNGMHQVFRLLLAPYQGDYPPQEIQNDAAAFAYPYLLIKGEGV